jgi:glycerophosphoryl diester phosphodiesterase
MRSDYDGERMAVVFKAHQCRWSGDFAGNSLEAVRECLEAQVPRAEIDVAFQEGEFVVTHDPPAAGPLFRDVVGLMTEIESPTLLELDMMDLDPLPTSTLEALLRLTEPVKDRVVFNSSADWNLRRLLRKDASLRVGFDVAGELDWVPEGQEEEQGGMLPRAAYGYLDAHPLARATYSAPKDYLFDRLSGIVRLVPGAREIHLRLLAFERMLEDGAEVVELVHDQGMVLDVWTLDAGTPHWPERVRRAVDAGVDVMTSNTPRELRQAI